MRWLIPDLACLLSAITLFYSVLLFDGGRKFFRDSDTGWHIRTGDAILAGGGLPRTDPYSFSRAGRPWFAWEWLADVAMAACHRWDGLRGVVVLYAALIGACTWIWFRLHWMAGGDFLIAAFMTVPMLSTVNLHWLARPHVAGWVLLLLALWLAERRPRGAVWMVPALGAAWANLHASFLLLPVLWIAYSIGHCLRSWTWGYAEFAEARRCGGMALVALAATLVNPYSWHLHEHVLRYLGDRELLGHIGEFQSFDFHAEGAGMILLTLGLAAAGGVLALSQKQPAHFLLAALFCAAALISARGLPVVALAVLPFANGALARALRHGAVSLAPGVGRRLEAALGYSARLRAIDARFHGTALAPAFVLLLALTLRAPALAAGIGFPAAEFPVRASAAIEALPAEARILAPDKFGGYLIYRFGGGRKVFFDGRSDFYGNEFMTQYIRLMQARPGWWRQFESWNFSHALLPNDYSLVPALEERGWKPVYRDSVVTLLERPRKA